jgi:hypothetical protein
MADEGSIDETNADKEIKLPEAETEEVDGEVILLDDQDGEVDATEVLDADIEKGDT